MLIEVYNLIGIIERYYIPICQVYIIIAIEIRDINREIALQIAFKAINNTIGLDSLIPILLVYSAYP